MEKEVKIGLAVIFVLLITFAGVLVHRFYRSLAAGEVLTASSENTEKPTEAADSNKDAFNNQADTKTANAAVSAPTVVAATAASSKPPLSETSDMDQWSTASAADQIKKSTDNPSAQPPTPSFMPAPPKPDSENHYAPQYNFVAGQDNSSAAENGPNTPTPEKSGDYRDRAGDGDPDSQTPSASDQRYAYTSYRSNRSDPFASYQTKDLPQDSGATIENNEMRRFAGESKQKSEGRTYTVAEGDSLFDIARFELGKAARWVEIYDLNRDILGSDLERLAPGTQIVIPDSDSQDADPVSRRLTRDYFR